MKRSKVVLLAVAVTLLVIGCALLGPSKNKILAWVDNIEEGTRYRMQLRWVFPNDSVTDTANIDITSVDQRSDRTVIRLSAYGYSYYLIAHDARGALYWSYEDTFDDDTMIMLKTPVEEGTRWFGRLLTPAWSWALGYAGIVSFSDVPFRITQMGGTREAGAVTADDVVTIRVDLSDVFEAGTVTFTTSEYYYSPTYGWLGEKYVSTVDGDTYTLEIRITDITVR